MDIRNSLNTIKYTIKEVITQQPLILFFIFLLFFSLIIFLIFIYLMFILQHFLFIVFIIGGILFVISITYSTLRKYKKNWSDLDLVLPLLSGASLIYYTVFLCIFFFGSYYFGSDIYITKIEPNLNHLSFIIAIFAFGTSLFYFVVSQSSTDNKLDLILGEINGLKENSIRCSVTSTERQADTPIEKDYQPVTDEDKIVYEHLFDRHNNLLSHVDALDVKIAQIIALNGLILSITIFSANKAKFIELFFLGIFFIFLSIFIGVYSYKGRAFYIGASKEFFTEYDILPRGEGLKSLKKQLILDIKRNEKMHQKKSRFVNAMIYILVIGLILIVVGYYA